MREQACFITASRPGGIVLRLGYTSGGGFVIALRNPAWRLRDGSRHDMLLRLPRGGTIRSSGITVTNGWLGAVTTPEEARFTEYDIQQTGAHPIAVSIGRGIRAEFALTGVQRALDMLDRCRPPGTENRIPPRRAANRTRDVLKSQLELAVARAARSWTFNEYNAGTLVLSQVFGNTESGNFEVNAFYRFNGFSTGRVRAEYRGGRIHCLYFWDYPDVCRR